MSEYVKKCKIHGMLTIDQTRKDGNRLRCKQCRNESNKISYENNREKRVAYSIKWKKENKGDYNAWLREDRKNNPEKYKRYEQNYIKKHGIEYVRKQEVARIHGLTIEEYDSLFKKNGDKCMICGFSETRLGRDGKTVTPLVVDHCHECKARGKHIIRGLLCHKCNSSLGKLRESPEILKAAYQYIISHKHI